MSSSNYNNKSSLQQNVITIIPIKHTNNVVTMNFDKKSDIQLFKMAKTGELIRSDYFTIKECMLCLEITPRGWNQETMICCSVYQLPDNVDSIALDFKYTCDNVSFKDHKICELTTPKMSVLNGKEYSSTPDTVMNYQAFANLKSFAFECQIDILAFYDTNGNKIPIKNVSKSEQIEREMCESKKDNMVTISTEQVSKEYNYLILMMQKYNKFMYSDYGDDILKLLHQFHKMLQDTHQSDIFDIIRTVIGFCNASNCVMFARNYRSRQHFSKDKHIYSNGEDEGCDPKYVARCQILDKIHCFCCHSYDVGNKRNNSNDGFDQHLILNDISNTTLKTIKNRMVKKYNQFDNVSKKYDDKFIFGWEFHYYDKTPDGIDDHIIACLPHYATLKEEIIHKCIPIEQFNSEYAKSSIHFSSRHRKKYFSDANLEHILAVMLYCNFDIFSFQFSETYRDHIYTKHGEFFHMGKLLKELILTYGTEIRHGSVEKFYHGMSKKLLLPEITGDLGKGVRIYCPLSTSQSYEVAINFANNNTGLV
eukprot:325293_1